MVIELKEIDVDIDLDLFGKEDNFDIDDSNDLLNGLFDTIDDEPIDDFDSEFDDLEFEPIDFDDEDGMLLDLGAYDTTDYTANLYKLQQHIKTACNEINKLESIKASEIQLPILRENYSFLDDNIFSIYVDIWKEALQKGLPSEEELLSYIYDVFLHIEYSLRLAKSEFEKAYSSDYKLVYNNILIARKKEKASHMICTEEEQQKIEETISILSKAITFSTRCNELVTKDNNINLDGNVHNYFPNLTADFLTGEPITTVQDIQRSLNTFATSQDVIDLIKENLNVDCSNSCPGEIIRLVMIMESNAYSEFYCPEENITLEIAFDVVNKLYSAFMQSNINAYLLLCCYSIIICGDFKDAEKELISFTRDYVSFLKVLKEENKFTLNPALINELEFKDGKTYAKCSKGGIAEIDDFYYIIGASSRIITIPVVNKCHCSNKDCSGCLFASPTFIASLIDWTSKGTIEGGVKDDLRYRVSLTPKEIDTLGISVVSDNAIIIKEQVVNKSLNWFLQFQDYINKFTFEEDNSTVEAVNYIYRGPIDADLFELGDTHNAYVNLFGIVKETSKVIVKLFINATTILDGVWEVTDNELILYFFIEGNISEQTLTIPLSECTVQTIEQGTSSNDFKKPDVAQFLGIPINIADNTEEIQQLASAVCILTGLPYEIQIKNARNRILTNYYHLFRFNAIKDFVLNMIATSYLEWLDTEECKCDWVNFSMLKMLLNTIYTDDNVLSSVKKCTELTSELIEQVKSEIMNNNVFNDVLQTISCIDLDLLATDYSAQSSSITAEDAELYKVALAIPPISNVLITLENKMVIASALYTYRKRLKTIFSINSTLLKVFQSEVSSESLAVNIATIVKKFKDYKNLKLFFTVSKLLTLDKDNSKHSIYQILKFFILKQELFDVISILLELEDYDFVDKILYELNCNGNSYTKDFFMITENKEIFSKQTKQTTIESIYSNYLEKFLEYIYLGINAETAENGNANLLVAYDILSVFYNELSIDLDDTIAVKDYRDFTDDFFRFLGNLYVTYGYVEDEAVMDTSEIKDRGYSFRQNPESFPAINSPYFLSLDLQDLLHIGEES